ncbi:hypothetical protein ASE66_23895 [Bosea sp. Root483D1]|uniref:alpha/beta fold hydrolase n=1 Tax=Bosea sp. Root483D1 TaxID=1736544 RepID=UPI00070B42A0|nr:alpha/beta fold hydrolase [Bosea sp. Root483D1]KRE11580.1 hypothetical protein ASE66_23895 [Bosea sp. Root483D1]
MNDLIRHRLETPRHATEWLEAGPADGRLMIFLDGLPGFSIIWRRQLDELAAAGWRCVAPDMRGYGGSSAPLTVAAYALAEMLSRCSCRARGPIRVDLLRCRASS